MRFRLLLACLLLTGCAETLPEVTSSPPMIADALPPMRSFGPQRPFSAQRSNAQMVRDFLDLSFLMESGREIPRMSRFEGPITVAMRGPVPATAGPDLDAVLDRMRSEARIDISRSEGPASVTIEFVPVEVLRKRVPTAACFVVPRVSSFAEYAANPQNADLDWTTLKTRERIAVFIPSDTSPQETRDCLHEELAQAIGPLNDLYRLPDSIFNDDNFHNVLTSFDMLMLRVYYAPEMRSGMTRAEAAAVVPGLLAKFNPRGSLSSAPIDPETPRRWISAIETAFGPDTGQPARIRAAERALRMAQDRGWQDARMGFSWFALARLNLDGDLGVAAAGFIEAARVFRNIPTGALHAAHVDMQMAAFALASGEPEVAILLADHARPVVTQAQNAALLATLLMIRSEALRVLGQDDAAQATRLDSLAWARYGFGSDAEVRARMAEITALAPPAGG
ncbi:DUF2927 domain-containing protein [Falsirhodobacter xinxiangensis]|uniref:DUF2927 domain-containing protein n=1 Tax=Falsirhodobacter xinxiangensis TaxID=2530049 RepID=UPI0010AA534E|nr:DUF2927 domain-containing protein [Rhodobacter xinxiangensis]